jgi:hypothetical protein
LPNNEFSIIQTTNYSKGVEVEDWSAKIRVLATGEETDITDYFDVIEVFNDTTGTPQITWSIKNLPFDFGFELVQLIVSQFSFDYFSNPFLLTEIRSDEISRFDYRDSPTEKMQSIYLNVFFRQNLKETELESYHEVSTQRTVTATVKSKKFVKYQTGIIDNDLLINISDIFENEEVFINLQKANLYKPIEINEITGGTRGQEKPIYISLGNEFYTPDEVIELPPHFSALHFSPLHFST